MAERADGDPVSAAGWCRTLGELGSSASAAKSLVASGSMCISMSVSVERACHVERIVSIPVNRAGARLFGGEMSS